MPLITDLDLARLDPSLFRDAQVAAQIKLERANVSISGATLETPTSSFSEDHEGLVAVVNGVIIELVTELSATTMSVSRIRAEDESLIPPDDVTEADLCLLTFMPLVAEVESEVRRVLRLGGAEAGAGALADDAVLNLEDAADLVALRTAARAFARAAAHAPDDPSLAERARLYHDLDASARQRLTLLVDRNGDGVAESGRPYQVVSLTRI